jgi:ABC-type Fe3+-hydroxamate transport system substrate-binding protein
MITRVSVVLATTLACSGFACEVSAHHSTAAEFDTHRPITFTGTVKQVQWMNPHIYTHVAVKTPDGNTVVYRVEGGPPNALYRHGWRMDSLKVGDKVTVTGFRAKNEASMHVGQATITDSAGKRVFVGTGPSRVAAEQP